MIFDGCFYEYLLCNADSGRGNPNPPCSRSFVLSFQISSGRPVSLVAAGVWTKGRWTSPENKMSSVFFFLDWIILLFNFKYFFCLFFFFADQCIALLETFKSCRGPMSKGLHCSFLVLSGFCTMQRIIVYVLTAEGSM